MRTAAETTCPYCGHVNHREIEIQKKPRLDIAQCDEKGGGCGKRYVIETVYKITHKAKIIGGEGRRQKHDGTGNS